ncbi:Tetraketide alpha-pyrone reductase 1 [Nymphaea thermarum]|nr:Tetraketide alpha-pyrone reductase 1 [Nymphaea thermarum]
MTISLPATEPKRWRNQQQKGTKLCVLDASSYVGFHLLKALLRRGYAVHAAIQTGGETEITKKIDEMSKVEEKMEVFPIDLLDYHSIHEALKGCSALFYCVDQAHGSCGYHETMVDLEVKGAINALEACVQTESIKKVIYTSSIAAGIWRENISKQIDLDEKSWSDAEFCRKKKLWYALAKTLAEKAAWALAADRMLNMVSVNAALIMGPGVSQHNSAATISYLKGAPQMYEDGLLALVDIGFLINAHVCAFENTYACGRYFCFSHLVTDEEEALNLIKALMPSITLPERDEDKREIARPHRLRNDKLNKLLETKSS